MRDIVQLTGDPWLLKQRLNLNLTRRVVTDYLFTDTIYQGKVLKNDVAGHIGGVFWFSFGR